MRNGVPSLSPFSVQVVRKHYNPNWGKSTKLEPALIQSGKGKKFTTKIQLTKLEKDQVYKSKLCRLTVELGFALAFLSGNRKSTAINSYRLRKLLRKSVSLVKSTELSDLHLLLQCLLTMINKCIYYSSNCKNSWKTMSQEEFMSIYTQRVFLPFQFHDE